VSVRDTLAAWRYEGGTPEWVASILVQIIVEAGLAAVLGFFVITAAELTTGLQPLYALAPTASGSKIVVWFSLSTGICYAFTLNKFIPER
jgi:hypothetical protein